MYSKPFSCCGGSEHPGQHTQDCDRLIAAKNMAWDSLPIDQKRKLLEKARRQQSNSYQSYVGRIFG